MQAYTKVEIEWAQKGHKFICARIYLSYQELIYILCDGNMMNLPNPMA
jgi:hypothetical protein